MKKRLLLLVAVMLFGIFSLHAQTSKVNVTIDGPGVVDEYYVLNEDGSKQVKLKAVPSKFLGNVTFDGWSGDATGTSEELTVDADKAQNIHATFTYHRPVKKYPLLNLKQSWAQMGKPMYIEMPTLTESEASYYWRGHEHLPVDYNRDGYIDYVQFPLKGPNGINNHRENVRFWLGKADGSFEEDPLNDNRMLGTVYSIHVKYADLNDDGYPDFCSFSSGYDREGSTYDYPVILMSSPDGRYTDLRFPDYVAYFHGGEIGDIDNDGDMDVVFISIYGADYNNCLLLINDGKGNFTEKNFADILDVSELNKRFSTPGHGVCHGDLNIIDLNNDGYNDLVFTGNDAWDDDGSNYATAPMVLWGNSSGIFGGTNYSLFPKCRLGYSINEDMAFYDLNGDGVKEIILERNGDGQLGGSVFYHKGYLQVCEWENGQYVDKTEEYIPVENTAYNEAKSETCIWIENVDGTDYVCAAWGFGQHYSGVGVDQRPIYAIRNGKLEPVEGYSTSKIPSFDEGLPIYVDATPLTDIRHYDDGVNEADLETSWVAISTWNPVEGNMWRINFAHLQNTHSGRTCIRWNRDGQNPSVEHQRQGLNLSFVSEVDISELKKNGYVFEMYIKNSDPNLSLVINGVEIDAKNTDEGYYTGEWQRIFFFLNRIWDGSFSGFWIEADKGDLNNEFYLDDIRIRRTADSGIDDYDRAFVKTYLDGSYMTKERTKQVGSQEFKAMLKPLIQQFAPDSMTYFNSYITDEDVPLTRGMAAIMAYYTARCIGGETGNAVKGDTPADIWDIDSQDYNRLLPHWNDPPETDSPEDKYWRGDPFSNWQAGWWWNYCHVSDHSNINVIALDKEANSFHWNQPFTWENAISAITRLFDSLDPNIVQEALVPVTITGKSYTIKYGDELPKFEFTSEGATIEGTPTISCEATSASPVGTYPIVITKGSVTHYNTTFVNGTLTIEKAPLKITAKSYTIKQGEELPTFEATYEGFKNNETSTVLTKQPAITTTATSASVPGEYEITISGAETQNYEISYVAGKLTIEAVEIVPISETEEKSFSQQVDETTDLQNTVIDNTYYNMDAANGDGYDATEQALVLNSTTSSTQMSAVQGAQVGDAAVRENFSGIIFELPAGKGVVTVDAKTIGTHVLNVQIGNGAPTQVKKSERGTVEVEYNVSAPTYVYLYASTESGASARLYRGPSAGANSVLLYGYKVQVGGTGIEELKNGKMEELKYYDLNGRKVKTPRNGVYIINGKKVIVK